MAPTQKLHDCSPERCRRTAQFRRFLSQPLTDSLPRMGEGDEASRNPKFSDVMSGYNMRAEAASIKLTKARNLRKDIPARQAVRPALLQRRAKPPSRSVQAVFPCVQEFAAWRARNRSFGFCSDTSPGYLPIRFGKPVERRWTGWNFNSRLTEEWRLHFSMTGGAKLAKITGTFHFSSRPKREV